MEEAPEGHVEDWVALTQNTLGSLISKPRMLPDRLKKPPFRFLFDIIVEVARQTGFGLQEVFGGELGEKPQMPNSREEKVEFLDRWIQASAVAMGEYGPWMAHVSAQNIVCGIAPEWTNFLLQCTAAIGWPQTCSLPAPPGISPEAASAEEQQQQTELQQPEAAAPNEAPPPEPHLQAAEEDKNKPELLPPATATAPSPSPEITDWTLEPMQLPAVADPGVDLDAEYQKLTQAQQEFQATANAWQQFNAKKAAAAAEDLDSDNDDEDSDDSEEPLPPPPSGTLEASSERPGTSALRKAAETTSKVGEELRRVQEMLDEMEEGLDRDEEVIQQRRQQAEEKKAQLLAKQEQEAEAERLRLEQQQRQEQMTLEEQQLAYEQEKERRRLKKEEKKRKKAEKKAAEEKARAVYPVSKTAASQGARMVAAFGDDEYGEEEFHEPEDVPPPGPAAPEVHVFGTDGGETLNEGGGYVDSMSGCFTDAILGDGPEKADVHGFDAAAAEAAFYASHARSQGGGFGGAPGCSLFDRLKAEMRDTYISFLTASMPETLLKKYNPIELIRCLQILLEELRKCLAAHNLEDVKEEEPTTLAETLRGASPDGWLEELQSTPAYSLKNKYDLPELIDTLQCVAGACSDRLTDEIGPLSAWCDKDSPLRFIPDIPILEEEETPHPDDDKAATWGSDSHAFAADSLDLHQHHQQQQHDALHKTGDHRPLASTASRLVGSSVASSWHEEGSPTRSPGSSRPEHSPLHSPLPSPSPTAPAPAFSAALGPALWEQEAMGLPRTSGPATAKSGRLATGLGTTGPRPPLMSNTGVGWSSSQHHGR